LIPAPGVPRGSLAHRSRFAPAVLETVNMRLTEGGPLLRSAETIQQSLSGNPCGQLAAVRLKDSSMSRAASTASLRNRLRRFRRSRRGSTAVEFALVAPVFFALLFAIIETSMVFFAGQLLESGIQDASRQLYTHQLQDSGLNLTDEATAFKNDLCTRVQVLMSCPLDVDVKFYPAGTPIVITDPIDSSGNYDNTNLTFQLPPKNSSATVVVRGFYQWPLFVTGLGYNIANIARGTSNSKRLLAATTAFHVEPY
jgi:Flp pilus assembly protein TadG